MRVVGPCSSGCVEWEVLLNLDCVACKFFVSLECMTVKWIRQSRVQEGTFPRAQELEKRLHEVKVSSIYKTSRH